MVTGHVFIATSLDGYIARKNGDINWLLQLDSAKEDHGYNDFISNIDTVIMGRGTYESIKNLQPWFYTRPVIVLSKTLACTDVPSDLTGKVRFYNLSPNEIMEKLHKEGCQRAYIDGGQLIQSFISHNLINDLTITQIPILLGSGRSLFGDIPQDIHLRHIRTKTFKSGFVQSHYEIKK